MAGKSNIKKTNIKKVRLPVFGYAEERDNFIENLLMLLTAGMDVLSAIRAVREETSRRRMVRFIDYLAAEVESGASLYQTLEGTGLVNNQALALIGLGERSGRLVDNLKVVALQQQKNRSFQSNIKSAMMYPLVVLTVAALVGVGVTVFIIPKFAKVFSSLHVQLPLITRIMISIGDFINTYGFIVVPGVFLALVALIYFFFFFRFTKFIGQNLLLYLPGSGRLVRQAEVARFGFIFGTLLNAGLPIVEALDALVESVSYAPYKKFYQKLSTDIEEGKSLRRSFESMKTAKILLPATVKQLIIAGEQSGNLADTLVKVGAIYEVKMELTSKNISVVLEPILLLLVGLVVLAVAVAVILPIYSLVGSL